MNLFFAEENIVNESVTTYTLQAKLIVTINVFSTFSGLVVTRDTN